VTFTGLGQQAGLVQAFPQALTRRRKAWHYQHEPRPGVTVIGARPDPR
jgi:hypothetical protein